MLLILSVALRDEISCDPPAELMMLETYVLTDGRRSSALIKPYQLYLWW